MKTNICCCTKSVHPLLSLFITSDDLGEGLEVGLDHLLAGGLGVGELHGDEPVVVVAALEEDLVGGYLLVHVAPPVVIPARRRRRRREGGRPGGGRGRAEEGGGGGGGGGEGSPESQREGHGGEG